jgi:hypothetical protein
MKKMTGFLAVLIMLMWANTIRADTNGLVNGSFEADGRILDITVKEPNGWDVNMPIGQFGGTVDNYWVTDGQYGLIIYSNPYESFVVGDIGFVSQDVYLRDVNQIVFDIFLDTYPTYYNWDPTLRSAVVMIDDNVVCESPQNGVEIRGEYLNQVIAINYDDIGLHKLSIGLRADANEAISYVQYYAYWDNIRFKLICGGNGFPPCDFNKDCRVDASDYAMLANRWLEEVEPNSIYNLSNEGDVVGYGIINFNDFAIWADGLETIDYEELGSFTDLWLSEVPYDNEWNLYKGDSEPSYGIVNYADLAIFVQHWLESSLP